MFNLILLGIVACVVRGAFEESLENYDLYDNDDEYYQMTDYDETQDMSQDETYDYDDALAEYNEFEDDNAWPLSHKCTMSGDPHTWTFDRAYHHAQSLMKPGWFWAVTGCRGRRIPFGFAVYYVPIHHGHWISVTRGLRVILTGGVTIETTHSRRGYTVNGHAKGNGAHYYDVRGNVIGSAPARGRALHVRSHGHQIWVKVYQSGQVIATAEYWNGYAGFQVAQYFKSARGKLCGFCGAYNGHKGRDYQLCDGKIIKDLHIAHFGNHAGRKKLECFSESWQVGVACTNKLCQNMPPEPPAHNCGNDVKNAWNPVCQHVYQNNCLCRGVVLDQTKWVRECVEDACAEGKCRKPNGNEFTAPELRELTNECKQACAMADDDDEDENEEKVDNDNDENNDDDEYYNTQ